MSIKIAEIVAASIYNQKGLFMAVHNRIIHLQKVSDYRIDPYIVTAFSTRIMSLLTGEDYVRKPSIYEKDGISYNIIWQKKSIIDYLLYHKLGRKKICQNLFFNRLVSSFHGYDLINCHSGVGELALKINIKYKIPYVITWHGSDINIEAFRSRYLFERTKLIIENAQCNFFVSEALLKKSDEITTKGEKKVLYNGKNSAFCKYNIESRLALKKYYNVENKKVVAFIGNLLPIKNIEKLPEIFRLIYSKIANVEFWIIGDGPEKKRLEFDASLIPIKFWGNISSDKMPDLLNCVDLVILPSRNEGLPLVCVEALACGCNVLGSNVGGIPEVVGKGYVYNLDNSFESNISAKSVEILSHHDNSQFLSEKFDWYKTALIEKEVISSILGN